MLKKIALAIICLFGMLIAAVFMFAEDVEFRVSEAEAQAAINKYLGSERLASRPVKIVPHDVSIAFTSDNKARIRSDMTLSSLGYDGRFNGSFSASVEYRRPYILLTDLELEDGEFTADPDVTSELSDLKKAGADALKRLRAEHSKNKGETIDNSDGMNMAMIEGASVVAAKAIFESMPIYDLSRAGDHGKIASLALDNVRFEHDIAILTFSPVTALVRILALMATFCLIMLWLLGGVIIQWAGSRIAQKLLDQQTE